MKKILLVLIILCFSVSVFSQTPVMTNQTMEMKKAKLYHTIKGSYKTYYTEISSNKLVGTKWAGIELIIPIKSTKISDTLFMNNRGEQAMRRLLDKFCTNFTLINHKVVDQFSIQINIIGGKQVIYAEGNLNCIR